MQSSFHPDLDEIIDLVSEILPKAIELKIHSLMTNIIISIFKITDPT